MGLSAVRAVPDKVAAALPVAVASSATNVTLLAANASRKGFIIFNDSTALLYVRFGATATSSDHTFQILAGGIYESSPYPVYTGIIDGIWAVANGNARVTELVS